MTGKGRKKEHVWPDEDVYEGLQVIVPGAGWYGNAIHSDHRYRYEKLPLESIVEKRPDDADGYMRCTFKPRMHSFGQERGYEVVESFGTRVFYGEVVECEDGKLRVEAPSGLKYEFTENDMIEPLEKGPPGRITISHHPEKSKTPWVNGSSE